MRMVETHGAPKISMNSAERDYKQRLRQAIAQLPEGDVHSARPKKSKTS